MGKKLLGSGPQPADPEEMTLGEWLANMRDPKRMMIRQRFPHESWKDEYLATIAARAEEEALFLIRSFLIESRFTYGCSLTYMGLMDAKKMSSARGGR
jgi:hypothetical protein